MYSTARWGSVGLGGARWGMVSHLLVTSTNRYILKAMITKQNVDPAMLFELAESSF
jgi:hypothetical protein